MKVYRVQRMSDGLGPYSRHSTQYAGAFWGDRWDNPFGDELGAAHLFKRDHPTPGEEPNIGHLYRLAEAKGWYGDEIFCACESLPALKKWFDGWMWRLWEEYHEIAVWEVPEECVVKGKYQVVFNSKAGRIVKKVNIQDVLLEERVKIDF